MLTLCVWWSAAQSSWANAGWMLATVRVVNPATGLAHEFAYNSWLGPRDSACTVELQDKTGGKKVRPAPVVAHDRPSGARLVAGRTC